MSKHNKVNKDHYDQAGRLTPDEMARERVREIYVTESRRKFTARTKPAPPEREPDAVPEPTPERSERGEEE
jgi:hypothetical protein